MIEAGRGVRIAESELEFRYLAGTGPGGQNVNKVATGVQLRFDVARSPSLPERVRERLIAQADRRLTVDGVLVIQANRFRTQERNRQDAIERLVGVVSAAAAAPPPVRRATRPTLASKRRRMDAKTRRGTIKAGRGAPSGED